MRVTAIRCQGCNKVVELPSLRVKRTVCEGCLKKRREKLAETRPKTHHIWLTPYD
jgi:hypothetical protein